MSDFLTRLLFNQLKFSYEEEIPTCYIKEKLAEKNVELQLLLLLCFYSGECERNNLNDDSD